MAADKDSISNTIKLSLLLCVICALLVSGAAVGLKGLQDENKELDIKKNVIAAAGISGDKPVEKLSASEIKDLFDKRIERKLVDLNTGEYDEAADPKYDPRKAAKDPKESVKVAGSIPIGLPTREPKTWVYVVKSESGQFEKIVLPIYGKGLWSTLFGFVAVNNDLRTISGLTFYAHAETPGLGGEVENPAWKKKWIGKQTTDANLKVGVAKGAPTPENQPYQVDGLAGATITSRGVGNLLKYWFSKEGFGPYLQKMATQQGANNGTANS
jgi:Na+-transporting NADH:ubiquinone oxidoreductase subunit C